MTCLELMTLALQQAGLDAQELETLRPRLLRYLNEGYAGLALRRLRPWAEELAPVRNGAVAFARLGRRPTRVLAATQAGRALRAFLDEEAACVRLPEAGDGLVRLRYRYLPQALEQDGDVPRLPSFSHGSLADFATYRLLSDGGAARQQRSQAFRLAYEETLRLLEPYGRDQAVRKRFAGLYE